MQNYLVNLVYDTLVCDVAKVWDKTTLPIIKVSFFQK